MHVQIVEFELQGVSGGGYEARCEQMAPAFAQLPGLMTKVWIMDRDSNRAGGVYTWADRAACEAYQAGELYRAALENPALANLRSRQFDALEAATAITSGLSHSAGTTSAPAAVGR